MNVFKNFYCLATIIGQGVQSQISVPPRNAVAKPGEYVILNCSATALATEWSKQEATPENVIMGNDVRQAGHPNLTFESTGMYDLVIPDVTIDYGDRYICRTSIPTGLKRARLLVVGK